MAITNKTLVEGVQLTAVVVSYYTPAALTTCVLKKLTATNSTAGAIALTVYLVPSGGAPGVTNIVTSAKSIAAGATYEVYEAENHVLQPGDSLQAFASAGASLTLRASGIEIV
jgi:hypothetical protein